MEREGKGNGNGERGGHIRQRMRKVAKEVFGAVEVDSASEVSRVEGRGLRTAGPGFWGRCRKAKCARPSMVDVDEAMALPKLFR